MVKVHVDIDNIAQVKGDKDKMLNLLENNSSKILKSCTVIIVLGLIVLSVLLSPTGKAITSSFKEQTILESSVEINKQADETLEELKKLEINMNDSVDLSGFIEEQKKLLDQAMIEYYNLQVQGLATEEELSILKSKIEQIRMNIYASYKLEIDKVIQEKVN